MAAGTSYGIDMRRIQDKLKINTLSMNKNIVFIKNYSPVSYVTIFPYEGSVFTCYKYKTLKDIYITYHHSNLVLNPCRGISWGVCNWL